MALRALYGALEFETLLAELGPEATVESEAIPAARTTSRRASRPRRRRRRSWVARPGESRWRCLRAPGEPRYVDLRRDEMREVVAARLGTLADPDGSLVGHDLKDVLRLLPPEASARSGAWDTMLVSYRCGRYTATGSELA